MSNNFDLKKFLVENKLTKSSQEVAKTKNSKGKYGKDYTMLSESRSKRRRLNESSGNNELINKVEEIALDPQFLDEFAQELQNNPNLEKQIEAAAVKLGARIPSGNAPSPNLSEQGLSSDVLNSIVGNTADMIQSLVSDQEVDENVLDRINKRRDELGREKGKGLLRMVFGALSIPLAIMTAVKEAAMAAGVPDWFINLGRVRANDPASMEAIPDWFWNSELGRSMMINIYDLPNSVNVDNFQQVFNSPGDLLAMVGIFIAVVALIALRNQSKRQGIEDKYSDIRESIFRDHINYSKLSESEQGGSLTPEQEAMLKQLPPNVLDKLPKAAELIKKKMTRSSIKLKEAGPDVGGNISGSGRGTSDIFMKGTGTGLKATAAAFVAAGVLTSLGVDIQALGLGNPLEIAGLVGFLTMPMPFILDTVKSMKAEK